MDGQAREVLRGARSEIVGARAQEPDDPQEQEHGADAARGADRGARPHGRCRRRRVAHRGSYIRRRPRPSGPRGRRRRSRRRGRSRRPGRLPRRCRPGRAPPRRPAPSARGPRRAPAPARRGARRGEAARAMAAAAAAWRLGKPPSGRRPGRGRDRRSRSTRATTPAATPATRHRSPTRRLWGRAIITATARRKAGLITAASTAAAPSPPGTARAARRTARPRPRSSVDSAFIRAQGSGAEPAAKVVAMRRALALLVALAASALLAGCSGGGLGGDAPVSLLPEADREPAPARDRARPRRRRPRRSRRRTGARRSS